jgi:hypothetical protein
MTTRRSLETVARLSKRTVISEKILSPCLLVPVRRVAQLVTTHGWEPIETTRIPR